MSRADLYQNVKFLELTTYRQNGDPVTVPVWFVEREGKLFVRTGVKSAKVKRMRRDPHVAVAPASRPGHVTGPAWPGKARFLSDDEFKTMDGWFKKRYGLQMKLVGLALWLGKVQACGIEITLDEGLNASEAKGGAP